MTTSTTPGLLDGHHIVGRATLFPTQLRRLPHVLRPLLENVQRCMTGPEREAATAALLAWLDTGRSAAQVQRVAAYAQRTGLWFEPQAEPRFTQTIQIDLGSVAWHIAGPQRPQDLLPLAQARATLAALDFKPSPEAPATPMPRHPVAIAAITSCTNTSDPALLIAAGLLARKARALGLQVPAWVKTSLAPGSPAAADDLQRAGLLDDLSAVGFDIVGYGCTTCIGNPGPLPAVIVDARAAGSIRPVAAISGNRNFPGRVHPDMDLGFLMSPPLVIAFALAGDAERDLSAEPVQVAADGRAVMLADLWPGDAEVAAALTRGQRPQDHRRAFAIATANPAWQALQAPARHATGPPRASACSACVRCWRSASSASTAPTSSAWASCR